jgi:D-inositol-3-phosphate glycosyltransferase
VYDVFYMTSWVTALAVGRTGKRVFLTQHVGMVQFPHRLVMAAQRLVYATWGRLLFRRAEKIVVYNTNVRDFLTTRGVPGAKVLLTHNGIDTTTFRPPAEGHRTALRRKYQLPPSRPVVLFVGRLVPKKGFDLVCRAHDPDWTTLVVGNGPDPSPQLVAPGVVFFGPATSEQLADLYQLADVFVFPAVGEIFTLVMQEALAAGLPVVSADDPGYANYEVDRTLLHFVPRDPVAIRTAIRTILRDDDLRAAMSTYSRRLAEERFSWQANYGTELEEYGWGRAG